MGEFILTVGVSLIVLDASGGVGRSLPLKMPPIWRAGA
jgi:hypothetical protein